MRKSPIRVVSPKDRVCAITTRTEEVRMAHLGRSHPVPSPPKTSDVPANRAKLYPVLWLPCIVVAFASAIVAIAVFSAFFFNPRGHSSADRDSLSFCCPQGAENMSRYVNLSLDPCKDFFAHVCSGVIRDHLWRDDQLQADLEITMVTGVWPRGVPKEKAGLFLAAVHKSCVKTTPRHDSLLLDLAVGLAKAMREFLVKPHSRNALSYVLMASIEYRLPPELGAQYDPKNSEMLFLNFARCGARAHRLTREALTAAVVALKDVLNITAASEKASKLRSTVCEFHPHRSGGSTYPQSELHRSFNRDAWNADDLVAGLQLLDPRITAPTTIYVEDVSTMKAIYNTFSTESVDHADGYKSAYLLWGSIDSCVDWFYPSSEQTAGVRSFDICNATITSFEALWQLFTAEMFTTREKDLTASTVFANVKNAVYMDTKSSSLFEPADAQEVNNFFTGISIISPLASSERLLEVPKPQNNFAENLLRARAYEFKTTRLRSWGLTSADILLYGPAKLSDGRRYELPATFYRGIGGARSRDLKIPEMADLGRLVAESLWHFVLYGRNWSPKTAANIRRLEACYQGSAFRPETNRAAAANLTVRILGLSSVLRALDRTKDWYTEKLAWSVWRLSHAQFFYILSTFPRCPKNATLDNARYINVPLASIEDFAKAFHCSPGAVMADPRRCTGLPPRAL
ncbi:hypothetical protein HPB48_026089 [Haemaphysalis longicornis]|uniref:Uncharacterized protein n=1 Tax=Haemaphysalis longicornis TaxID=44386 RepID=A0A9J6H090_HAELO|nr:hypothetical protein HPB48_026089 [Haemaphysalis longicornis]